MAVIGDSLLEVVYNQILDGQVMRNMLWFRQDPADTVEWVLARDFVPIVSIAKDLWIDEVVPIWNVNCTLTGITLNRYDISYRYPPIPPAEAGTPQRMLPLMSGQVDTIFDTAVPGAVTGDCLPRFNAFRATKLSGQPGRKGRGHISISGLSETDSSGDYLTSGDWTTWQTNAVVLLTTVITYTPALLYIHLRPCVFSVTSMVVHDVAGDPVGPYGFFTTGAIPNKKVGSMVRRKLRGGVR